MIAYRMLPFISLVAVNHGVERGAYGVGHHVPVKNYGFVDAVAVVSRVRRLRLFEARVEPGPYHNQLGGDLKLMRDDARDPHF